SVSGGVSTDPRLSSLTRHRSTERHIERAVQRSAPRHARTTSKHTISLTAVRREDSLSVLRPAPVGGRSWEADGSPVHWPKRGPNSQSRLSEFAVHDMQRRQLTGVASRTGGSVLVTPPAHRAVVLDGSSDDGDGIRQLPKSPSS